jgi:hypothetical protein
VNYSEARYLSAKKTVDDRALNKDVVERLRGELRSEPRVCPTVLELGAGLGTMVARLIEWDVLRQATYHLLEVDATLVAEAAAWLSGWASARGHAIDRSGDALRIGGNGAVDVTVKFLRCELGDYLDLPFYDAPVDLLIANAFMDLVDVAATLPPILSRLASRGVYWFSINFDGETIFQPEHEADDSLLGAYHRSMDERIRYGKRAGDSRAGRHLFGHLSAAGAAVLAAGASDWIVCPRDGRYEDDEAYFLHHIVHTIDEELRRDGAVDKTALAAWAALRHAQVKNGELVYIAHQIDLLGRAASR